MWFPSSDYSGTALPEPNDCSCSISLKSLHTVKIDARGIWECYDFSGLVEFFFSFIFFKRHQLACVYVGVIRFQSIQSSLTGPVILAFAMLMWELINLQSRLHAAAVPVCTPCLLSLVSGVFGINFRVLIWSQLQQLSNDGCLGFCKQACWQVLLTSSQFICLVST